MLYKIIELVKQNYKITICIVVLIIVGIIILMNNNEYIETEEIANLTNSENVIEEKHKTEKIIIHITGCVKEPGIIEIAEGSRINDAVELAGGLTEDADITNVNLAYVLEDGMKIKIPSINDEENEIYIIGDVESNETNQSNGLININKATQEELDELPGIGPSIALKIIQYREENGEFKSIEDIKNVSGIGDSKYSDIEELITVK